MAPTRLEDLPDEILELVFGFLQAQPGPDWRHQNPHPIKLIEYSQLGDDDWERRDGLRALCSVNKRFQAICQPLLYRYMMPPKRNGGFYKQVSAWLAAKGNLDGAAVSSATPPLSIEGTGFGYTTWLTMSCCKLEGRAIHQSMFATFTGLRCIALDLQNCVNTRVLLDSAFVGMQQLEEVSFSSRELLHETMHSIYRVVSTHLPNVKHLTLASRLFGARVPPSTIPFTLQKLQSFRFCDVLFQMPEFKVFLGRLQAPCLGSITVGQWVHSSYTDLQRFPSHLSFGIERLYLIYTLSSSSFVYSPIGPAFPALKSLTLESGERVGGSLGLHIDLSLPDTIQELYIKGPTYVVINSVGDEIGKGGLSQLRKLVIDIGRNRTAGAAALRVEHFRRAIIELQKLLHARGISIILQGFQISWTADGAAIWQVRETNYRQRM